MTSYALHTLDPDLLTAQLLAFKFLGESFMQPPDSQLLHTLIAEDLFADWPLSADDDDTRVGLALLRAVSGAHDPAVLLPMLRADYAALFVGPDRLLAAPWESVYLSHDHLIFDEQTVQVRDSYARFGLQIPQRNTEPDDHMGFELLFLSYLSRLALQAQALNQADVLQNILTAQESFLRNHILRWSGLFIDRVIQHAATDYYRGLAYLLRGSLAFIDQSFSRLQAAQ